MNRQVILLSLCIALTPSAYGGWDGLDRGGEVDEAMNLTPNLEHGEEIYQTCAFCHTESGWGMASGIGSYRGSGTYPQIAGQHQSVLIKQVLDIRKLNRDNPTMYPFSTERYLGGPQNIADVTAYITNLPISTNNQHYEYMLRQFIWIKDGKRRNANPKMVKQIQKFKYSEMKAVIDYASRLGE